MHTLDRQKTSLIPFLTSALAFFSFSSMDAILRYIGQTLASMQIGLWQRSLSTIFFFSCMLFLSFRQRSFKIFKIRHLHSHLIRGCMIFFITIAFIKAFTLLPLSNAYSIVFSLPLFTTVFARFFIKEKISILQFCSILVGFLGIVIVLRPSMGGTSVGYFYVLLGIGIEAPMFIMIRHYHKDDHPLNIGFYPAIIAQIMFIVYAVVTKLDVTRHLNMHFTLFILLLSVFSICAQLLINYSLARLKAGLSLSMQFTQIVWGALYGLLVFKDTTYDLTYVIGTVIIIYCSIVVTLDRIPFTRKNKRNDAGLRHA